MKQIGLPSYHEEIYSNRKFFKTLFIVSTQWCVRFVDDIKILRHFSLNIQKTLTHVPHKAASESDVH